MMCKRLFFLTAAIPAMAIILFCPVRSAAQQATGDDFHQLLQTISFEVGSATIEPSSFESLDGIAALFKRNPESRYEIQGHSDAQGDPGYNMRLSMARATAVRNYIVKKGVPTKNVIAIGYGIEKPVASNATAATRAENRRVEIVLIESQEEFETLKKVETEQRKDAQLAGIKGYEAPPATLKIVTEPSETSVKINDRDYGLSPITANDLEPGTHNIELSKEGYLDYKTTIKLGSDEEATLNIELVVPATLTVISKPAGAQITIDGKDAGTSPAQMGNLHPGECKVSATMDGYVKLDTTVDLKFGSVDTLHIVMERVQKESAEKTSCGSRRGKTLAVFIMLIAALAIMSKS